MSKALVTSAIAAVVLLSPFAAAAEAGYDWDHKAMAAGLRQFAGKLRGHYTQVYPPLVSDQILENLTGPPETTVDLPGGLRLVSGCRWQSCDEKAAVILSGGYQVQAAAMIHFGCYWTQPPHRTRKGSLNGPSKCDENQPVLTVFMHHSAQSDELNSALQAWARQVHADAVNAFHADAGASATPRDIVWVK